MAFNGTEKTLQFKRNSEMIENLLQCLENYKTMMCTKNKDFHADRTAQYRFIRGAFDSTGTKEDEHFFGQEKSYEVLMNGEE